MDDTRYSSRELKQIMDLALRQQRERNPAQADGHSLDDVIAIGRELGVDAEAIRSAANAVKERAGGDRARALTGGELVQTETAVVPAPMSRELAEELAADLRRIAGFPGHGSVTGRHVSWQSNYLVSQQHAWSLNVSVAPRGEQTRIEVEGRNGFLAGGLFGGVVGGMGLGAGVGVGVGVGVGTLGSALFAIVVPIATIGVTYLFARGLFTAITRNRRRRIARMVERIKALLEQEGAGLDPPR